MARCALPVTTSGLPTLHRRPRRRLRLRRRRRPSQQRRPLRIPLPPSSPACQRRRRCRPTRSTSTSISMIARPAVRSCQRPRLGLHRRPRFHLPVARSAQERRQLFRRRAGPSGSRPRRFRRRHRNLRLVPRRRQRFLRRLPLEHPVRPARRLSAPRHHRRFRRPVGRLVREPLARVRSRLFRRRPPRRPLIRGVPLRRQRSPPSSLLGLLR